MLVTINEYTMNKAALLGNGLQVIEHFGRFLVCKEHKNQYKVFLNTASFNYALKYAYMM